MNMRMQNKFINSILLTRRCDETTTELTFKWGRINHAFHVVKRKSRLRVLHASVVIRYRAFDIYINLEITKKPTCLLETRLS